MFKSYLAFLLLAVLLFSEAQANFQFGNQITNTFYGAGSNIQSIQSVVFGQPFENTPKILIGYSAIDNYQSYLSFYNWNVSITNISTKGFEVLWDLQCGDQGNYWNFNLSWVAIPADDDEIQIGSTSITNANPGDILNVNYSILCPTPSVNAKAFLTGISWPVNDRDYTLSLKDITYDQWNGSGPVTGKVTFEYNTYGEWTGQIDYVNLNYVVACSDVLITKTVVLGTQKNNYNDYSTIQFENYDPETYSYGFLATLDGLNVDIQHNTRFCGSRDQTVNYETGEIDFKVGTWNDSTTYNAIIALTFFKQELFSCPDECAECKEKLCTSCIDSYLLVDGACVDYTYYTYWYVDNYNYFKTIGEIQEYEPGTGYFVNTSIFVQQTYYIDGESYLYYQSITEDIWAWVSGDLSKIKNNAKKAGYWVYDKYLPDQWYQPPAFDPENPSVNWTTWAWILEYILTYSTANYSETLDVDEVKQLISQQKYQYSEAEIEWVFDYIDEDNNGGISYGEILKQLIIVEYGDYANRIIGECSTANTQN